MNEPYLKPFVTRLHRCIAHQTTTTYGRRPQYRRSVQHINRARRRSQISTHAEQSVSPHRPFRPSSWGFAIQRPGQQAPHRRRSEHAPDWGSRGIFASGGADWLNVPGFASPSILSPGSLPMRPARSPESLPWAGCARVRQVASRCTLPATRPRHSHSQRATGAHAEIDPPSRSPWTARPRTTHRSARPLGPGQVLGPPRGTGSRAHQAGVTRGGDSTVRWRA